ncbi:MAG: hypothetical protein IBJ18_04075 [Phycisphaerales bacterium]|nr:hypothetical protein [Phycisphaerales bacterium]
MIKCLLEEYRQLYTLVAYRLNALDQRIPITTAILSTVLVSVIALPPLLQGVLLVGLPPLLQGVLLVGLPPSLVWLVRTTANHARSLEDALRRIDQIEREVNAEVGRPALVFQSSHPSRGVQVGGRTGEETVQAVLVAATVLLCGCVLILSILTANPTEYLLAYCVFACLAAFGFIATHRQLRTYRYEPRSTENQIESK